MKDRYIGKKSIKKLADLILRPFRSKEDLMEEYQPNDLRYMWTHNKGHILKKSDAEQLIYDYNDLTHWNICEYCSEKVNQQDHIPGSDWVITDTHHWKICTTCGGVVNKSMHIPEWRIDRKATFDQPGQRTQFCNVCGKVLQVEELELLPTPITDWTYTLDGAKRTVTLLKYVGSGGSITIQNSYEINGIKYSTIVGGQIASTANAKTSIISVIFEDGVTFGSEAIKFQGCTELTSVIFSKINTSNCTNMQDMFSNCSKLTELDLTAFNTNNVTNMAYMFINCESLTDIKFGSEFKTAKVDRMDYMFRGCRALAELDLSGFDTGKVTTMESMISYCDDLRKVNVSSFDTSTVTTMQGMFGYSGSLQQLDLRSFDISKVKSFRQMFCNCTALTEILVSSEKWHPMYGRDETWMYTNCGTKHVTYV